MQGLDVFEEDASSTVFRDVIMLALVGFVALVILMLPHIHPPGATASDQIAPPGNVIVEIRWPDQIDADSTSGYKRRATSRSATPTRAGGSSTCCATISDYATTRPG
jgi:hypothetical protein